MHPRRAALHARPGQSRLDGVHRRIHPDDGLGQGATRPDRRRSGRRDRRCRTRQRSGSTPRRHRDRRGRPVSHARTRRNARPRSARYRPAPGRGRGHPLPLCRQRHHHDPGHAGVALPDPPRGRNRTGRGARPQLLRRRALDQRPLGPCARRRRTTRACPRRGRIPPAEDPPRGVAGDVGPHGGGRPRGGPHLGRPRPRRRGTRARDRDRHVHRRPPRRVRAGDRSGRRAGPGGSRPHPSRRAGGAAWTRTGSKRSSV